MHRRRGHAKGSENDESKGVINYKGGVQKRWSELLACVLVVLGFPFLMRKPPKIDDGMIPNKMFYNIQNREIDPNLRLLMDLAPSGHEGYMSLGPHRVL